MTLGVSQDRVAMYVQEWVWQRNDRQRIASTGEIIAALKAGLITPDLALARLVNIGWAAPSAMVELALAEHEIAAAAARASSAEASKIIAADIKAQREAAASLKTKQAAAAKAETAQEKAAKLAQAAPLEQDAAISKYKALSLLDLEAYNSAAKKGKEEKMQAEIEKATHAYKELLLTQLKLVQEGGLKHGQAIEVEPLAVPPDTAD